MSRRFEDIKVFTFTWKIKNWHICNMNSDERHESNVVTAESLNSSKWYLSLRPAGVYENRHLSCFLHRNNSYEMERAISISFIIRIIGPTEEVLYQKEKEICTFEKGTKHGWDKFVEKVEIAKVFDGHSYNTLTFQCAMKNILNDKPFDRCETHSKFNVLKKEFTWHLKKSGSCLWSESKNFTFSIICDLQITLTAPHEFLIISIKSSSEQHRQITCKITLLASNHGEIISKIESHYFQLLEEPWMFPSFIKKHQLGEVNDIFALKFEFSASYGMLKGSEEYSCGTLTEKSFEVNTFSKLRSDLHNMMTHQKHTDINLRTSNGIIPAHKCILSARSPVFSTMFDQDMLETRNGFVELPDVDERTMKYFLQFLYTGDFDNMEYEIVRNLIFQADKYQVLSLQQKCSSLLISMLNVSYVCEIFTVADLIKDTTLLDAALDYIKKNTSKILKTSEWKTWMKQNVELASEIISTLSTEFEKLYSNISTKLESKQDNTITGTSNKFYRSNGRDTEQDSFRGYNYTNIRHQCITTMNDYKNKSLELTESDGSGEQDESTTELPEEQEPDFPLAELARLDEMINRPRWVVPVLPKRELEILLDAAINLSKLGIDNRSEACQRFYRDGLTISFTKILTGEAVSGWYFEIHRCIMKNCEHLVELCVLKLKQDCLPLLELLAMVLNPNSKFHTFNGTRPSETFPTGSQIPEDEVFARPADLRTPKGWLVDLINRFGSQNGFCLLLERFQSPSAISVPVIAALIRPFGMCHDLLTVHTIEKFFMPIVEIVPFFLDNLTDEELKKEAKNDALSGIVKALKCLTAKVPNQETTVKSLETFRLKMILRSV